MSDLIDLIKQELNPETKETLINSALGSFPLRLYLRSFLDKNTGLYLGNLSYSIEKETTIIDYGLAIPMKLPVEIRIFTQEKTIGYYGETVWFRKDLPDYTKYGDCKNYPSPRELHQRILNAIKSGFTIKFSRIPLTAF
jgi:hypothetical protein